jgi:hypothetical protein
LEPLKSVDGIPRLRLLNRLNAKRLKELQERKLLEAAASSGTTAPSKEQQVCAPAPPTLEMHVCALLIRFIRCQPERSVEELLSFISGGTETKASKKKAKAKRTVKTQSSEQTTPEDGQQQEAAAGDGCVKLDVTLWPALSRFRVGD